MLFLELRLLLRWIGRDTHDYCTGIRDPLLCVAKLARLLRSTGCVGLWIEKEYYVLTAQAGEVEHLTGVSLKTNGRRYGAGLGRRHIFSLPASLSYVRPTSTRGDGGFAAEFAITEIDPPILDCILNEC
jgi:hypothetical protein